MLVPVTLRRGVVVLSVAAAALPLVVLGLLLGSTGTDRRWENNAVHFWIVLIAGLVSVAVGYAVRESGMRRRDARQFLIGLAFLASAGFLALHALATPG